ncbi:MAG: hypothetical protein JWQ74_960 [Marmoricola sp.]|nr:hypothetical protein [Marmoricola sp.]
MRTAPSWTELRSGAADLRWLLAFRRSGLATTRGLKGGALLVGTLTVAAVVVPAYLRAPLHARHVGQLVAVLPSVYLGFALLTVLAAISSGGGREVVPREQAVAFPVSPVTEHLGALLLAPLNIAWLLQAWTVLGVTTYVTGPARLPATVVPLLLWIAAATAVGQLAGWVFEGIRRGEHGTWVVRGLTGSVAGTLLALVLTDRLTPLLDSSPTVRVYLVAAYGSAGAWGHWALGVVLLVLLLVGSVLLGLLPAGWALHRPQREELRLESGHRAQVPNPRSDLGAMVRIDRASIWRAVPLRRGLVVLALMPGAVALAGNLEWDLITVLPGLVASGAALLFGVNAWCLDGRGALWRDSLPVAPRTAFAAKVVVLLEVLVGAGTLTLVLAGVRAGPPTAAQLAAVVMTMVVVAVQVTAASLHWSVTSPYAVDLRSARATPAPPVVMAGYSARLAARTTIVGLVFSASSYASDWRIPLLVGVPLLCWSTYRLLGTAAAWDRPEVRARVVAVTAG